MSCATATICDLKDGSVYSLMSRIFEHSKEPLFGRANHRMNLKAFIISTLKEIVADYLLAKNISPLTYRNAHYGNAHCDNFTVIPTKIMASGNVERLVLK